MLKALLSGRVAAHEHSVAIGRAAGEEGAERPRLLHRARNRGPREQAGAIGAERRVAFGDRVAPWESWVPSGRPRSKTIVCIGVIR
jgi:hypothetical protein